MRKSSVSHAALYPALSAALFAVLGAAGAASAAGTPAARPSVLRAVPGDVRGAIIVPSLVRLRSRFHALMRGLMANPATHLHMVTNWDHDLGLRMNPKGAMAIAVLHGPWAMTTGAARPDLIVFLPVKHPHEALHLPANAKANAVGRVRAYAIIPNCYGGICNGWVALGAGPASAKAAIVAARRSVLANHLSPVARKFLSRYTLGMVVPMPWIAGHVRPAIGQYAAKPGGFISQELNALYAPRSHGIRRAVRKQIAHVLNAGLGSVKEVAAGVHLQKNGLTIDLLATLKRHSRFSELIHKLRPLPGPALAGIPYGHPLAAADVNWNGAALGGTAKAFFNGCASALHGGRRQELVAWAAPFDHFLPALGRCECIAYAPKFVAGQSQRRRVRGLEVDTSPHPKRLLDFIVHHLSHGDQFRYLSRGPDLNPPGAPHFADLTSHATGWARFGLEELQSPLLAPMRQPKRNASRWFFKATRLRGPGGMTMTRAAVWWDRPPAIKREPRPAIPLLVCYRAAGNGRLMTVATWYAATARHTIARLASGKDVKPGAVLVQARRHVLPHALAAVFLTGVKWSPAKRLGILMPPQRGPTPQAFPRRTAPAVFSVSATGNVIRVRLYVPYQSFRGSNLFGALAFEAGSIAS